MNPLSPLTYYLRHKRQTLLLLILISLMTLGISVMVRLPDSFLEHMHYSESYVTRVSLVSAIGPTLDPGLVSQIRSHPDVAQVMQEKGVMVIWPPITGDSHLFGVSESDMQSLRSAFEGRSSASTAHKRDGAFRDDGQGGKGVGRGQNRQLIQSGLGREHPSPIRRSGHSGG
jgi:hypothetical protein